MIYKGCYSLILKRPFLTLRVSILFNGGHVSCKMQNIPDKINIYKLVTFLWQYCCNNTALYSKLILYKTKFASWGNFS